MCRRGAEAGQPHWEVAALAEALAHKGPGRSLGGEGRGWPGSPWCWRLEVAPWPLSSVADLPSHPQSSHRTGPEARTTLLSFHVRSASSGPRLCGPQVPGPPGHTLTPTSPCQRSGQTLPIQRPAGSPHWAEAEAGHCGGGVSKGLFQWLTDEIPGGIPG